MAGRARVLAHVRRQLKKTRAQDDDGDDPTHFPPKVDPGQIQLFSYYTPALEAGDSPYTITATQTIKTPPPWDSPTDPASLLTLKATQQFNVLATQYVLEPGAVHSTYPPQGHGDHAEILPHIVFNDPHLPWERFAIDNEAADKDNQVPWLALLTFDTEELLLSPKELNGDGPGNPGIFAACPNLGKGPVVQDTATLSVSMTVADLKATACAQPIPPDMNDAQKLATRIKAIFVPGDLFTRLVSVYDASGNRSIAADGRPELTRYQYLAHVRNINTLGMADAGVEDQGLYSVICSHRTGKRDLPKPKATIVHLVSLEHVQNNIKPKSFVSGQRVGLVSLYSWTYLCLPNEQINFHDAMRAIGLQSPTAYLRAPDALIANLQKLSSKLSPAAQKQIGARLSAGYSLVRWRTRTGESTLAFLRGPLTPQPVPHPLSTTWLSESNFGSAYLLLDPQTGIMDVSYSTAWNLGKTLAIGDRSFSTALTRLRTIVHTAALNAAKAEVFGKRSHRSKSDVLETLPDHINNILSIQDGCPGSQVPNLGRRWRRNRKASVDNMNTGHLDDEDVRQAYVRHVALHTARVASSTDGRPFNETNTPLISEWQSVFSWILDRMYLVNVPAYYLLNDPSYLPMESIRFFNIDRNWIDALVDGALSLANHLERKDDIIRRGFKTQINTYLNTLLDPSLGHLPQVPTSGFLLHSAVVAAFPGLKVSAPWHSSSDNRAEVLRLEVVEKNTLLCLLDRTPAQLKSIIISQPDHQQCFRAGVELSDSLYKVEFLPLTPLQPDAAAAGALARGVSTLRSGAPVPLDNDRVVTWLDTQTQPVSVPPGYPQAFDWDTRTIITPNLATSITKNLGIVDIAPNAAMMGFQLNDSLQTMTLAGSLRDDGSGEPSPGHAGDDPGNGLYVKPSTPKVQQAISTSDATSAPSEIESLQHHRRHGQRLEYRVGGRHHRHHASHHTRANAPLGSRETIPSARAPHLTPLFRFNSVASTSPDASLAEGGVGVASQFKLDIFAAHTGPSQGVLPADLPYALDLVFGFTPYQQDNTLNLYKIEIRIPMGSDPNKSLIKDPYTGYGARMTANPRFIVRHSTMTDQLGVSYLVLNMLPRSQREIVSIPKTADLSHILAEAKVDAPSHLTSPQATSDAQKSMTIWMYETYKDRQDNPDGSVTWTTRGVVRSGHQVSKGASKSL